MKVITNISLWQKTRQNLPFDKTLGVVMTMGALHKGHLSLIEQSKKQNDFTLVSIFINPTQFNNQDDLAKYPKTWDQDIALLEAADVDFLFAPCFDEMYPDDYRYKITENSFSQILCGKSRPGHFDGVLTVVMKLLQLAQAHRAYFGEKDYQQLHLIKQMVKAFFISTKIIGCPIIREEDGLAFSSRNIRLSKTAREKARLFAQMFHQNQPLEAIKAMFEQQDIEIDYLEAHCNRRFAAVLIDGVRLIDNLELKK
ncbi:pantoate--beta-alanine ligase [Facilibium subflavum]|uniref:pantoate--beta-alanine ligase n=1 Tax=Facilibium subflavum TaxID=2219058 RepID=UPI000E65C0E7|nr:pantoate--beta-alanine ligase [Facilibium subflavum]